MSISKQQFWVLSFGVVFGLPVSAFFYFSFELASGVLPSTSDSIMFPIFGALVLSALISPFIFGVAKYATQDMTTPVSLLAWNRRRPVYSGVVSIIFAILIGLMVFSLSSELNRFREPDYPWFSVFMTGYQVILAAWLIAARAAATDVRPVFFRSWKSGFGSIAFHVFAMPAGMFGANLALLALLALATAGVNWQTYSGPPLCRWISSDPVIAARQPVTKKCPPRNAALGNDRRR